MRISKRTAEKHRRYLVYKRNIRSMLMLLGVAHHPANAIAYMTASRWPKYKWLAQNGCGVWNVFQNKPHFMDYDRAWHESGTMGRKMMKTDLVLPAYAECAYELGMLRGQS